MGLEWFFACEATWNNTASCPYRKVLFPLKQRLSHPACSSSLQNCTWDFFDRMLVGPVKGILVIPKNYCTRD